MRVGMVGLGRMGAGMAARLRRGGHEVVGYDAAAPARDVGSVEELVERLPHGERVVWLMLPAGSPTQETLAVLARLLDRGDVVVDGGNSRFRDSLRQAAELERSGIGFVDAGVSGGIAGEDHGYAVMVGGGAGDVDRIRPLLEALAPPGGFAHVGPAGAGHLAKMVHNGVEYGLMQAYAEGYELLSASDLDLDVAGVLEVWRHGSVVRSWLLDLLADAVSADPDLGDVRGYVEDSGEGRWMLEEALERAVPVPALTAALFARYASRQDDSPAMRAVATLRRRFGGHATRPRG